MRIIYHFVLIYISYSREYVARLAVKYSVTFNVLERWRVTTLSGDLSNFTHGTQVELDTRMINRLHFKKKKYIKIPFQSSELANAQINKKSTYRKLQLINPGLIELRKGFRWTYIRMNKGVSF